MTKYHVDLVRRATLFAEVIVEADSEEEAEEKALASANQDIHRRRGPGVLYWESDEPNADDPEVNEVYEASEDEEVTF